MKFGSVLFALGVSASLVTNCFSQNASPDDLYLEAYRLIQEGDSLIQSGQSELARQRYSDAQAGLKRIQTSHPGYSKNAVEFRLDYLTERMKGLPAPRQEGSIQRSESKISTPAANANDPQALRNQVTQLQADNAMLQAKLQEALAPRPAAIDPSEYVNAQQRIHQLEKEKELLRVRADHAQAKQPQAVDTALLDQARGELEATKRQLRDSVATIATLSQDNQRLQTATQSSQSNQTALKDAQNRLESERASWQKERSDYQTKLAAAKPQNDSSRVKELEKERDTLLKRFNDANKELNDGKNKGHASQYQTLTNQLSNLRARLEVYEARKVPFTAEELALMDKNVSKLASTPAETPKPAKRPRELPAGAAAVVAEAERAFAARRYNEAEEKYKQVLKMDEENPSSLANLAAIQLELQKLNEAEANLKKAVAVSPDDAYSLSLMGMLRFQQGNYEQAFDFLSRSAQIDPKNAETQNYLGITLSQQGQREAAETALRKAITLNPNYAGAHHNLAVVYATQKPPFLELAKLHYNKALALGQVPNPELEKQIGR